MNADPDEHAVMRHLNKPYGREYQIWQSVHAIKKGGQEPKDGTVNQINDSPKFKWQLKKTYH